MTRQQRDQSIKLALVALALLACACLLGVRASAGGGNKAVAELWPPAAPPDPPGLSSSSNARTEDG